MFPARIIKQVTSIKLLKQSLRRQRQAEDAREARDKFHNGLLKESRLLLKGLRFFTHATWANQEQAGEKIGKELQEDITQMLLGLSARLLALRQEARCHTRRLREEISSTQKLVTKSASSVFRATPACWGK